MNYTQESEVQCPNPTLVITHYTIDLFAIHSSHRSTFTEYVRTISTFQDGKFGIGEVIDQTQGLYDYY